MFNSNERLMSVADVAELLGVPVRTVYEWRYKGDGPRGHKVGRYVRYRREAVEQWLDEHADKGCGAA